MAVPRKGFKNWRRGAVVLLAAAVSALLIGTIVLQTPWVRRAAMERAFRFIEDRYGARVTADAAAFNLLDLRVDLENVRIETDGAPFLEADRLVVDVETRSVLTDTIVVDAGVENARIAIVIDEEGQNNLPRGGPDNTGGGVPDVPVRIRRLRADGSLFSLEDRQRQIAVSAPMWQLDVESDQGDEAHTAALALDQGLTIRTQDFEHEFEAVAFDGLVGADSLDVRSLRVQSAAVELDASGTISDFELLSTDLTIQATLDVDDIVETFGADPVVSGRLDVDGRLVATREDLTISGEARGEGLEIGDFSNIALTSGFSWDHADERVDVDRATVSFPEGVLRASGTVGLADAVPTRLEIETDSLDIERLGERAGLGLRISSRARGNAEVSWTGFDWRSMAAVGTVQLEPSSRSIAFHSLPVAGNLAFDGSLETMDIVVDSVRASNVEATGRVVLVGVERIEGEIRGQSADAAVLTADVARLLNETSDAELSAVPYASGPAEFTTTISGALEAPEFSFALTSPGMVFPRLADNVAPARIDARGIFRDRHLTLDPIDVAWNGEALTLRAEIDLAGDVPNLSLVAAGAGIELENVLTGIRASAPGPEALAATLDLDARANGSIDSLSGDVVLRGSAISAYGKSFELMEARVRWTPESLEVVEFTIAEGATPDSGRISGSGSYSLDSDAIDAELNGNGVDLSGIDIPRAEGLSGRATFEARATGTASEPRVTFDADIAGAAYGGFGLDAVDVSGNVDSQGLALTARIDALNLDADAVLAFSPGLPARIEAETTGIDVEELRSFVPSDRITGIVSGSVRGEGDLENWAAATATVELDTVELAVDSQRISTNGPVVLRYEGRRLEITPFTLIADQQELLVSGELPAGSGGGEGTIRILGTLDLASSVPLIAPGLPTDVGGNLSLDVELSGALPSVRVDGLLELRGGSVGIPGSASRIAPIDADLHVEDGVMIADGIVAYWEESLITLEGAFPLNLVSEVFRSPVEPIARLNVMATDFNLASLPGAEAVEGVADVFVDLESDGFSLENLSGSARLDRLELDATPLGVSPENPIVITLENGAGRIEPFALNAANTEFRGDGEFQLTGDRPLRIDVEGRGNTAVLTAGVSSVASDGNFVVDLSVDGTLDAPLASGEVRLENVAFDVTDPPIEGRNLNATMTFTPGSIALQNLSTLVNDGTVAASGTLSYEGTEVRGVGFDVSGRGVYFQATEGFETLSNAYIQIRSGGGVIDVTGGVQILDGSYSSDVSLEDLLSRALGSGQQSIFVEETNPLLARVRYNVNVVSLSPILVSNNVAELEADVNVRLTGTYDDPGLVGRVFVAEGGTVRLQGTEFVMQAGFVDFSSPTRIEPDVSLSAATTKAGYEITLDVSGGGTQELETSFTSVPVLPEPEIITLLVTGRRLEDVRDAGLNIGREQALYALSGGLTRTAQETLGISRVSIEPNLIANESDPGARLTVGQDITRNLGLIYSMNLDDSNDQIWIAEYDVRRRFLARSIKQPDNSYRFELQHRMTFGGVPLAQASDALADRRIGTIAIAPATVAEIDFAEEFGLETGDSYDPFTVRDARRRLTAALAEKSYLEAAVRVERVIEGDRMNLEVMVEPGPLVRFVYQGTTVPNRIQQEVRRAWSGSTFDSIRGALATQALRRGFITDRYFEVEAMLTIESMNGEKVARFDVVPGLRYERVEFAFPGAEGIDASDLEDVVNERDGWGDLILSPERPGELIEQYYRSSAYLDVSVAEPEAEFDPGRRVTTFRFDIIEGPEYHVGSRVVFSGNERVPESELTVGLPEAGTVFEPEMLDTATDVVYQHYWERGFSNATVFSSVVRHPETGIVDLAFDITENLRDRIESIEITGNNRTSEGMIRGQVELSAGDYLNIQALGTTRRNLYDTGAYSLVDVESVDVDPAQRAGGTATGDLPVRLRIDVREVPPYSIRYGTFYDTERGPGGTADFRNQNSLGNARTVGLRLRYDGRLREARTYFSQPALLRLPFQSNAGVFLREERTLGLLTREFGLDLQQEVRLGNEFIMSYGYSFQHTRSFDRDDETDVVADEPFDISNVAPLSVTLTRDTRDDLLDASRGTFMTHSFSYAPEELGSDNGLVRYFGQFFRYRPLSEPVEIPYSGGRMKSRLVYAVGARLGLAGGLNGSAVPPGERFFAGGGTTIRGFEQDTVGPLALRNDEILPIGGGAVLMLNNELRFPVVNIFDGVTFFDVGNVYESIRDFDPFHLRSSAGVGLRVRTPFFLLRADYGVNLNRKPGERSGTFFFSIGQAF